MKYAIILLVVAVAVGAFAAPGEAPKEKRGLALGYHGSLLSQSYVQPAVVSSSSYISHPSLISHGPVLAHAPLVAHAPYISHAPLALHY